MLRRISFTFAAVWLAATFAAAQGSTDQQQASQQQSPDAESSSKQTKIDMSAPPGDVSDHPYSTTGSGDVSEMHPWNPHRADKDVEVGDFYYKRKNYRAAEDRFREALIYKPGDAIATYRLAEVLDAQGRTADAVENYEQYLKIPSSGKFTAEAKKALARLEAKTSQASPQ